MSLTRTWTNALLQRDLLLRMRVIAMLLGVDLFGALAAFPLRFGIGRRLVRRLIYASRLHELALLAVVALGRFAVTFALIFPCHDSPPVWTTEVVSPRGGGVTAGKSRAD